MKKITIALLNLWIVFAFSCVNDNIEKEKPEEQSEPRDAFVIGFDQCARRYGRILAITDPPDTVIAYNFPDTIYTFPDYLFSNYQFDCLFPEDVLKSYPVRIRYRPSKQEEFSTFICFGDIYTWRLSPLIKNKQVVIQAIVE